MTVGVGHWSNRGGAGGDLSTMFGKTVLLLFIDVFADELLCHSGSVLGGLNVYRERFVSSPGALSPTRMFFKARYCLPLTKTSSSSRTAGAFLFNTHNTK